LPPELRPDTLRELTAFHRPLAGFQRAAYRGRRGEEKEGQGRKKGGVREKRRNGRDGGKGLRGKNIRHCTLSLLYV